MRKHHPALGRYLLAFGAVTLAGAVLAAQSRTAAGTAAAGAGAPHIEAAPVPEATAIQVDGEFNEDAWTKAAVVTGFAQRSPKEGVPATYQTEVRILYDATALYVAVTALDPEPKKIVGILTRRDDSSPSDTISILLDSYHDRRTAYEFGVNAAGVKFDRYWFNDTNNDAGWDAVWDVAVKRDDRGWRAEFRIPFSQLRFNPSASSTFGFAAVRMVPRLNETSTWPLLPQSASGYVSSFGDLTGLTFSRSPKKLELAPYALTQLTTQPVDKGNPLVSSPDPNATVGLDLKYRVLPGLTLTGTVNPDFGQVEADPAVVNLSGFETFFAERRPFFVEGSGNFSFDIDCNDGNCSGMFYSRRIGRAPQRSVDAPAGGYESAPTNTTILGAAKLTGRIGKFSVGVLDAVTSREDARLAAGPGATLFSTTPVEPASNYTVVRANREFKNQSRLGFIFTDTDRRLPGELSFLPRQAVTGGIDADWRLGSKGGYSLTGFWAGSSVRGSQEAIADLQQSDVHTYQRPDAKDVTFDPTRTVLQGDSGSLSFNKITGRLLHFTSNVGYKSPGFDINDVGFLTRADEINASNWFQLLHDRPGKHVRSFRINFNQYAGWNFDGDLRYNGGNINAHWTLVNNWSFGTGFNVNGRGFDDRLTRGGPGGYFNSSLSQWGYINSDERKAVMGYLNLSWFNDRQGSRDWNLGPGVTWRPQPALAVSVSLNLDRNLADTQWVENVADGARTHYVFGRLDQTTVGISTRVNYTITPNLTVQIYAQPFISAGAYDHFKELVNGRAPAYAARYAAFAYATNPDFNYHSFRTTNVLRWEFRPGSALFVVWQQGRQDTTSNGDFSLGRDLRTTFNTPATNVFLVKISRWLNF